MTRRCLLLRAVGLSSLLLAGCGPATAPTSLPTSIPEAKAPTRTDSTATTSTTSASMDGGWSPETVVTTTRTIRETGAATGAVTTTRIPVDMLTSTAFYDAPRVPLAGLRLGPGADFTYRVHFVQEPAGQPQRNEQLVVLALQMPALGTGPRQLWATITRVTLEAEADGQHSAYDSKQPNSSTNPLAALRPQLNHPFAVVLGQDGKPQGTRGLPAPAAGGPAPVARLLAPARAEDVLRQVFDIYPPPYEWGLAVGDVWEQTRSLTVNGEPLTRHLSYTLIGLDQGRAYVRLRGELVGTCERPARDLLTGTYIYDVATGLLRRGRLTRTYEQLPAGTPAADPAQGRREQPVRHPLVETVFVEGQRAGRPGFASPLP